MGFHTKVAETSVGDEECHWMQRLNRETILHVGPGMNSVNFMHISSD